MDNMRCKHGIAIGGSSVAHCEYCDKQSSLYLSNNPGVSTPATLSIRLHDQEPMAQLISAIFDLLNHQSFDVLPDDAKAIAFNFVGDLRRYNAKP